MAARKRVILVDGSSLIYRAYFALPGNLTTASGLHTNAIYGFATMFRKLMSGRQPTYGAVVFDGPQKIFRHEKYPQYKANRPPMPDELREQLPWIDRLVAAHNFPMLRAEGYEADDVIGTLAREATEAGMEVIIISGDKDFAQLISEQVRMLDTLRDVTYDPELVFKKWGVHPHQMVDLLALVGDKADNIPGVPGIGQKGAAGLLAKYGSLDGILAELEQLKGRQRSSLEQHVELARLCQELATIDLQVPLAQPITSLTLTPPDPASLNELFKELQFYSLLSEEALSDVGRPEAPTDYAVCDSAQALEALLADCGDEPVAVLPVFDSPSPVSGPLVGIVLAPRPGQAAYVPADPELLGILAPYLSDPARPKVSHNAKELWIVLQRAQISLAGVVGDTMLASFLVDPAKLIPHRLDQCSKEYLQRPLRAEKTLLGAGKKRKQFSELAVDELADYACHLADALISLWPEVEQRLENQGQTRQLHEHDLPLSWVLGRMELQGIQVDPQNLKQMGEEFGGRLRQLEQKIHQLAGREFNIASTKQLSSVLFEELELPVIKKTKTGYSTNMEVLERLAPMHEIAQHLLEHRKLAKLINTYTDVLQAAADPKTHRIHATFQQTVGVTGRLITTDPDLQRTPVKTPEGNRIREAFIPAQGRRLICADWSQIELRLLAHFSDDALLVEAFSQDLDIHSRTAGQIFDCAPEAVTRAQRGIGKTVNFATIYGQGATALGQSLGIPRKEAKGYIEAYFEAYAGVRQWLDQTIADSLECGYVTTLFGRRRYIPELSSNSFMIRQAGERIAANTPIQGSAADICKLVMLQIPATFEAAGLSSSMVLQVHDELIFEATPEEEAQTIEIVRDRMEQVVPLKVPLKVDIGVGGSWAEAK